MADSEFSKEKTPLIANAGSDDNNGGRTSRAKTKGQGQPTDVGDGKWMPRLRDAEYRAKVISSVEACLISFSVGLVTGQLGPALLDLQQITQTTVQEASTFLTAASAGNIVGAMMSGIIYDNCNKNILLILYELLMGLSILVIPFCTNYWLMVSACFLNNVFRIFCNNASTVEIFRIWGTQATNFVYARQFSVSIGAIISPLITEPFLSSGTTSTTATGSPRGNNHNYDLDRDANFTTHSTPDANFTTHSTPDASVPEASATQVHSAFLITSAVCVSITALLVVDYIRLCLGKDRLPGSSPEQKDDGENDCTVNEEGGGPDIHETAVANQRKTTDVSGERQNEKPPVSPSALNLPVVQYIVVVMWMGLFFFVAIGAVNMASNYWASFAVLQMGWGKSQGAFLSSVYWCCIAFTRVVCFFLTICLTPLQVLATAFIIWIPSVTAVVLMSLYGVDWGVWLSIALSGVGLSPIFPCSYAWMNANLVTVTGKVASAMSISVHLGSFVSLWIVGSFIENHGTMWFTYVLLGESIIAGLVLVSLNLFFRLYLRPKFWSHCNGN